MSFEKKFCCFFFLVMKTIERDRKCMCELKSIVIINWLIWTIGPIANRFNHLCCRLNWQRQKMGFPFKTMTLSKTIDSFLLEFLFFLCWISKKKKHIIKYFCVQWFFDSFYNKKKKETIGKRVIMTIFSLNFFTKSRKNWMHGWLIH